MATFKLKKSDFKTVTINGKEDDLVLKKRWDEFNSSILGLGNISEESNVVSAISAIFDLQGFTNFCKQSDPQLSTPIFLTQFLNWFFQIIKNETKRSEQPEGIETWHDLPILTKFLGDGILVIWDTNNIDKTAQRNIIASCQTICESYQSEFFPNIKRKVTEAPTKLRCGLAKGNIFSVGNGNDFVGPCINLASRLQKLPGVNFVFCDRGFNVEDHWAKSELVNWVVKKVNIRGISESELVYIQEEDLKNMTPEEKEVYLEP